MYSGPRWCPSSGANLLFPQLPAFLPSGDFWHSRISSSGSCQAKGVFPQTQCLSEKPSASRDLAKCSNTGQFRGALPTKKSIYKPIDKLKHHPGFTSIPAQSYLPHSLTGWFPREISKVLAPWKPYQRLEASVSSVPTEKFSPQLRDDASIIRWWWVIEN